MYLRTGIKIYNYIGGKIMRIKDLFIETVGIKKKDETFSYSDLLGFNRNFRFILTRDTVANESEFKMTAKDAEFSLEHDLKRLGEDLCKIDPMLRNKLMGKIGSMTLICDDAGKLSVKFHKRDEDGYWDGKSKRYPEKDTTGKYKHEIFFAIDDEEDDE